MGFRTLTKDDIAFMREHTVDKDFYKDMPEVTDYSYALFDEDRTLGVGGFHMMNNTTAVCWFDLSDIGYENTIQCYRTIREWMDGYTDKQGVYHEGFCDTMGIRRLEAYVRTGFEYGIRTVEHLGFEWQCRAMKYFGDYPADVYVKFYGDK